VLLRLGAVLVGDRRPAESKSIHQLLPEAEAERIDDRVRVRPYWIPVGLPPNSKRVECLKSRDGCQFADVRLMKQAAGLLHLTNPGHF
jgi:hypothetical protein